MKNRCLLHGRVCVMQSRGLSLLKFPRIAENKNSMTPKIGENCLNQHKPKACDLTVLLSYGSFLDKNGICGQFRNSFVYFHNNHIFRCLYEALQIVYGAHYINQQYMIL